MTEVLAEMDMNQSFLAQHCIISFEFFELQKNIKFVYSDKCRCNHLNTYWSKCNNLNVSSNRVNLRLIAE